MPSLFDSETDASEERKVLKRTLSAQKITFILTALCAVIYLLQNIGFEEPMMDLFHYPAYSWEDQEIWRYFTHAIVHLSVPHILFSVCCSEWRCTELLYRSRLFRIIWRRICGVRLCVGGGQIAPA